MRVPGPLVRSILIGAIFFPFSFWVCASAFATPLTGKIVERGTRKPVIDANVYLVPDPGPTPEPRPLKATSDRKGDFSFESEPSFPFHFVVNVTGYKRLDLPPKGQAPFTLYLERVSYAPSAQVYETTIYGQNEKRDDKAKSLTSDQFLTMPGSNGDPIKAVQNLPGVNRTNAFSSQVVIEGSAPEDTQYTIDGHEVPNIFHFGGLSSVVTPEALDRVDYLYAGYGPEYGRALGGYVGVWTRNPKMDDLHGFAFVDIFNAGGLVEGPIGQESSLLFSFRQSYIGAVLKAAFKGNSDFNLTAAPDFRDSTIVFHTQIDPIDDLKIVGTASEDTFAFILSQPVNEDPALRGTFSTENAFFRLIPELTHRHGEKTISRWSFGIGKDWISVNTSENYLNVQSVTSTARVEVEHQPLDSWKTYLGVDNQYTYAHVNFLLPQIYSAGGVSNPFSTGGAENADIHQGYEDFGVYTRNVISIADTPLSILPGGRVDYFSSTRQWLPAPRLALRYKVDETLTLRSANGLYYQSPQPQEFSQGYGNPNLITPRAWHATLGAEKDLRHGSSSGFVISGDAFYKYFQNLVEPSTAFVENGGYLQPLNYDNSGGGRAFGIETLTRFDLAPLTGWIAYTLSRSTRFSSASPETLFTYDQTHALTALFSVEFLKNFKFSTRFRYVTGDPTTPVLGGSFDSDNDVYIPVRGSYYSDRLPAFVQLDLRLDKKWVFNRWILSAYLDIQNVTNRQNYEGISYSYNYSQSQEISGLPFLPTFGLKGEF